MLDSMMNGLHVNRNVDIMLNADGFGDVFTSVITKYPFYR